MSSGPDLPSASGARLSGDDYQHLFTWFHALQLLRDESDVATIEFEVGDAGNIDDLVVHFRNAPTLYHQIKYVVSQVQPLTHEWFTTPGRAGGHTPLQRFRASYTALTTGESPPEMVLLTNRQVADGDPILRHLGGRDDKLVPRLAAAASGSASGRQRRVWANHLGISEEDLLTMLKHFAIKAGRSSIEDLRNWCTDRMAAVGLRGHIDDVILAIGLLRELIGSGCRGLDRQELQELVSRPGFGRVERQATLLIQAIDHSPNAEGATEMLDWVARFEGDSAFVRRQLRDPTDWNGRLKPELGDAADRIRSAGYPSVRLDGAFRLSVGFAAGEALQRTTGVRLAFRDYVSDQDPTAFPIAATTSALHLGADIAVGVSVTADLTADAVAYLRRQDIPVARFVNITPQAGPGLTSIPSPSAGVAFAFAALQQIRTETEGFHRTLHLFMACPNPIAVMLGHVWNRVPDTQLHDDANALSGYFPSFHFARH